MPVAESKPSKCDVNDEAKNTPKSVGCDLILVEVISRIHLQLLTLVDLILVEVISCIRLQPLAPVDLILVEVISCIRLQPLSLVDFVNIQKQCRERCMLFGLSLVWQAQPIACASVASLSPLSPQIAQIPAFAIKVQSISPTHMRMHTHTQAYLARNDLHDYFDWYCRPHQEGSPHQEDCPHQEDSELAQLS